MLPVRDNYGALMDDFRWEVPERFNIAKAVCDDWADRKPDQVCLQFYRPNQDPDNLTYAMLCDRSNRLANGLAARGIKRGDRVALLLPQSFETLIAHIAIYKLGAIAVPLALLFGPDALAYRLDTSGAVALITNGTGKQKASVAIEGFAQPPLIISTDDESGSLSFETVCEGQSVAFETADTSADDPAMMIFTSGTTGPPKGALHGHRVLLGHLPGVQFAHEFFPQPDDRFWTPADWAWAGGLLNVLLPSLYFGVPVVASDAQKFDPETAFDIMARMRVRNAFLPPTALRMLKVVERPAERYGLCLRTIGSGGESLGRETLEWAQSALGLTVNEFYGQTECNLVLSSCAAIDVSRPGAIGKTVPGHKVAVIDNEGREVAPGTAGQIAVRQPDPVMFLEYWNNPEATARKFIGDWMVTGDQGIVSDDGYVSFFGRDDDVITSAGYRIGPGEIEDCLTGHPAIALAAAVGKPDPMRTEIVKAYVVLKPDQKPTHALAGDIQDWVKNRLSAHEYPREVEFVSHLPLTTTGKVIRRELRERAIAEARSAS